MNEQTHSAIGASTAERWFGCPGSVRLCKSAPPEQPSEYAERGTAAHWVGAHCLDEEDEPENWVNEVIDNPSSDIDIIFNQEDCEAVRTYLDFIASLRQREKLTLNTEIRFNLDNIHSHLYGTCDAALMRTDGKKLIIVDYKHGAGVPVEVIANKQLLYYALGAIKWFDDKNDDGMLDLSGWGRMFDEVEIYIVQPRCNHKDGPIRLWKPTPIELDDFAEELELRAQQTEKSDAPLKAGTYCRWCPAQPMCPAFRDMAFEVAKNDFVMTPAIALPTTEAMSMPDMIKVMEYAPMIKGWIEKIGGHLLAVMQQGTPVPGYKLVKKKANRQWKDAGEAVETLKLWGGTDACLTVKSPAQVEKALKAANVPKDIVDELTYKPDTGVTMAPESDKRPAIDISPANDFERIKK